MPPEEIFAAIQKLYPALHWESEESRPGEIAFYGYEFQGDEEPFMEGALWQGDLTLGWIGGWLPIGNPAKILEQHRRFKRLVAG
jgi:hypothetical protein